MGTKNTQSSPKSVIRKDRRKKGKKKVPLTIADPREKRAQIARGEKGPEKVKRVLKKKSLAKGKIVLLSNDNLIGGKDVAFLSEKRRGTHLLKKSALECRGNTGEG